MVDMAQKVRLYCQNWADCAASARWNDAEGNARHEGHPESASASSEPAAAPGVPSVSPLDIALLVSSSPERSVVRLSGLSRSLGSCWQKAVVLLRWKVDLHPLRPQ